MSLGSLVLRVIARKRIFAVALAAGVACVTLALRTRDTRPELVRATDAVAAGAISVGPNIHVSAALPRTHHAGCTLAADPSDPGRLFAASMHWPSATTSGIAGYASRDGGATWQLAVERTPGPDERCCDEALAFAPDGALYLAHMRGQAEGAKPTVFACSADGGATWEDRATTGASADRPQLAVDCTHGPFRGRVYCSANDNRPLCLSSADGARTLTPAVLPDSALPTVYPSEPVVLSDGTVLIAFRRSGGVNAMSPPQIVVWRSTDGGRTFAAATPVPTAWRHARARSNSGLAQYPLLAADPGSPGLAGRVYCAWTDGARRDERCVLLSASSDRGSTWTQPLVLSEQPLGRDANADWEADLPAIAVNRDGVVAVSWYDRRGLPKSSTRSGGVTSAGYNVRLRASRDGGITWLPSVLLNEPAGTGDLCEVRNWVGMAADAEGKFHPLWISDHTGSGQLWTATVRVGTE